MKCTFSNSQHTYRRRLSRLGIGRRRQSRRRGLLWHRRTRWQALGVRASLPFVLVVDNDIQHGRECEQRCDGGAAQSGRNARTIAVDFEQEAGARGGRRGKCDQSGFDGRLAVGGRIERQCARRRR